MLGTSTPDLLLLNYEGDAPACNPFAGTTETPNPEAWAVPLAVFTATVDAVNQGGVKPGAELKVAEFGGMVDGTDCVVPGSSPLKEDETGLQFLATYLVAPASILGVYARGFTK